MVKALIIFPGKSAKPDASLKYLDTNAQSTVNKQRIRYPHAVAGLICYRDHMDVVEQLTDLKVCKVAGSL